MKSVEHMKKVCLEALPVLETNSSHMWLKFAELPMLETAKNMSGGRWMIFFKIPLKKDLISEPAGTKLATPIFRNYKMMPPQW